MPPARYRVEFFSRLIPPPRARARGQIIIVAVCLLSVVKLDGAANADAAAASHTIKVDALLFLSSRNRRQAHGARRIYFICARESRTRGSRHQSRALAPLAVFMASGDAFLSHKLPTDEIILPCAIAYFLRHMRFLLLTHPRILLSIQPL
jgi:hypothetical protein